MVRLGLWGKGTAFETFSEFAQEIEEGGVGAMEMTARDLKAMDRYFCGSLSVGADAESGLAVEYREVVHHLTAHQREMYDNMARVWQAILQKTEKALALTNSEKVLRRFVVNNFWAEHQRCSKAIITAFKVPTLIREIERALSEQHSIIVSITSTGEASMTRQMARSADEEEAISNLDFSPRETLIKLIENCFPTALYQEVTDEITEKTKYEPLIGENGEQIHSKAALALKQELLDCLATLALPEHPLDQLINHFGAENVAEITGRKMRLVKLSNGNIDVAELEAAFALCIEGIKKQEMPAHLKKRWARATEKAKDYLIEKPFFNWQPERLLIVSIPKENTNDTDCRFTKRTKPRAAAWTKPGCVKRFKKAFRAGIEPPFCCSKFIWARARALTKRKR